MNLKRIMQVLKNVGRTFGMFFILGVLIAFSFNGCKDFGAPNYTLEVVVNTGTTGTPATGKYVYKDLELVDYSYTAVNTANPVEVLLNSSRISASGSITMYGDEKLEVRLLDISGKWAFKMYPADSTTSTLKYNVTFALGATLAEGTFSDDQGPGLGYHGTWKIDAANDTITLTYTDWKDYVFTGSASSMSGTWTGESNTSSWSASRASSSR